MASARGRAGRPAGRRPVADISSRRMIC